jgi:hypothetical protein
MRAWRARASELFEKWRNARYRAKQGREAVREQLSAEELNRAREGVDRFPPMGGAG